MVVTSNQIQFNGMRPLSDKLSLTYGLLGRDQENVGTVRLDQQLFRTDIKFSWRLTFNWSLDFGYDYRYITYDRGDDVFDSSADAHEARLGLRYRWFAL